MRFFSVLMMGWAVAASLPSSAQQTQGFAPVKGAVIHGVVEGDTMGALSRLYGVSPERLRELNGGRGLEPGLNIWVPPSPSGWAQHTVLETQTLEMISSSYGIPIEQLRQANQLKVDTLIPSQVLVLPRRLRPQWSVSKTHHPTTLASRGARTVVRKPASPLSDWVEVKLSDGRTAWVRPEAVVFKPPRPSAPSPTVAPRAGILFGKKLNATQKDAIHKLVARLKSDGFEVKADDIVNFMALETGGTFSTSVRSRGGAVGLAQFTDIAIADMNRRRAPGDKLSKGRLAKMSFAQQSVVVGDYLSTAFARKKMQGKRITAADLYSAIFAPRAIGLPLDATVYSANRDPGAYSRNRSLDRNRDGRISKRETVQRLQEWAKRGEAQRG